MIVDAPSVEDAISILRGLRERYEVHHGVRIQDNALVAAAVLSNRYVSDRFLPDKAIDLVDEACALIRTEIDSMPAELDEAMRRSTQLEIEEAALLKEKDRASRERLQALRAELADLKSQTRAMRGQWEQEKGAIGEMRGLKEQIEETRRGIEEAERRQDLNEAAQLKYGRLPDLERPPRRGRGPRHRQRRGQTAARGGDRSRGRRDRVAVDGGSRHPAGGGRAREAAAPRRDPAPARRRAGRGGAARRRCRHSRQGGNQGPPAPHRVLHFSGTDRGRQDRAGQDPGRGAVSTARRTWSASTCRSTWRSTPCPA